MKWKLWIMGFMLMGVPFWMSAKITTKNEGRKAIQGYWTTISDKTHKPSAVIKISMKNNQLYGQVIKSLKKRKKDESGLCEKCPLPFKDKEILGLEFLWGLKQVDSTHWSSGHILDPESGHIYNINAQISEDGQKLFMRGYIGFAFIGRTQTWLRRETL